MLRVLFYDPIVEGSLVKRPPGPPAKGGAAAPAGPAHSPARPSYALRITGVVITFIASGLAHEVRGRGGAWGCGWGWGAVAPPAACRAARASRAATATAGARAAPGAAR